jgi:hypothetical protein
MWLLCIRHEPQGAEQLSGGHVDQQQLIAALAAAEPDDQAIIRRGSLLDLAVALPLPMRLTIVTTTTTTPATIKTPMMMTSATKGFILRVSASAVCMSRNGSGLR